MSEFRILVPAGIGDFSWLWSKFSTTGDTYHIEYANARPDRLGAFLDLLPKDKVLSYKMSEKYQCFFKVKDLTMVFSPTDTPVLTSYDQLKSDVLNHIEPNTHLEHGSRVETWMPDIPTIDFHYKIEGVLDNPEKEDIFIVHLSSTHTFKVWKHYDVNTWVGLIHNIAIDTGFTPVFIGGIYDDFAKQVYDSYHCVYRTGKSVIGMTDDVLSALHLIQRSKFFMGAVSSGMTMLANVLRVPSVSWWPRPMLPQSWNAPDVPYLWLMWKDPAADKLALDKFLKELK